MTTYSDRMNINKQYEFTFEPKSLWYYENNKILENTCDNNYGKETIDNRIGAGRGTFMSGWNKEFHKRLVEYYICENEIIFDPFAGHSSSFIPYLLNRNFVGFEITKERYDIQLKHLEGLKNKFNNNVNVNLINDSSENINLYNIKSVDCIITDPPFWNVEKYGTPVSGTQLSDINQYKEFLNKLTFILSKSIDILRDNGFLILKLADFRKDGVFYDLSGDMVNQLKDKITLVDKIVLELNPSKRHPLYIQAITNKNMLKVHEFVLIFRKITNNINDDNDRINQKRPKVSDIYENETELFWSTKRGKIDYITNKFINNKTYKDELFGE